MTLSMEKMIKRKLVVVGVVYVAILLVSFMQ